MPLVPICKCSTLPKPEIEDPRVEDLNRTPLHKFSPLRFLDFVLLQLSAEPGRGQALEKRGSLGFSGEMRGQWS